MRRAIHGVILLVLTVATAGCGPELNQENLGQIQTTVEQLPGFGEPYPLPKPRYEADEETGETTRPDKFKAHFPMTRRGKDRASDRGARFLI